MVSLITQNTNNWKITIKTIGNKVIDFLKIGRSLGLGGKLKEGRKGEEKVKKQYLYF